ncbi:hypothetical protein Tco_0768802 [Tanacetum coccineum]
MTVMIAISVEDHYNGVKSLYLGVLLVMPTPLILDPVSEIELLVGFLKIMGRKCSQVKKSPSFIVNGAISCMMMSFS